MAGLEPTISWLRVQYLSHSPTCICSPINFNCVFGTILELFATPEEDTWTGPDLTHQQELQLYYATWIFYIWIVAYSCQVLWITVGLLANWCNCESGTKTRRWLHLHTTPLTVYVCVLVGGPPGILGWLFLFTSDRNDFVLYAPLCLLWALLFFHGALVISLGTLRRNLYTLLEVRAKAILFFSRILVQNGLGVITSWLTAVLFYNVALVLKLNEVLDLDGCRYVWLGLVALYVILGFLMDVFIGWGYTSHLLTPYIVTFLCLVQVVLQTMPEKGGAFIFAAVLTTLSCSFMLVKVIMAVKCGRGRH